LHFRPREFKYASLKVQWAFTAMQEIEIGLTMLVALKTVYFLNESIQNGND
jgi:hypothetical protein